MPVPGAVLDLVERFERNRADYLSGRYNETQLRREFLDPFFELLGWDVSNRQGYADAYKDVIHEDAIKVGGATKAPDYCFRVGGTRRFFVEAKKPAVNLRDDPLPAFQLRRYAWSAKLPLSILSDFHEFAVYDCRIRPVKTDKPATARVLYLPYTEYPAQWDHIAAIFSKDAVLHGSFDQYAESGRAKKGTAEVDDAFLAEIESWRDVLARNLALRNPQLSPRELNFAVQMTIDRIIFLRICEDRGIESYGRLLSVVNGGQVYARLCDLFSQADARYNSGLFHFQAEKDRPESPDELSLQLTIDDKLLKQIIESLYYPDSPYEFSVLPADILGQVYEQFLGKVIRLTAGHQAKVEEKPEVRKAGGVYYTPTYIVEYIVKHTVGKLLEGKTPQQVNPLRILDPACGSGSFLIGAYQYLLDWYRDQYIADDPERWAKARPARLYQMQGGEWRLTTAERKRILVSHIYGVDIDRQAVEVTKLSLLLKVLEGETERTLGTQLRLFQERVLPDLGQNIKCGNSLISPDYFTGQMFPDSESLYRVNPFDWAGEFPTTMSVGGFDVVIGNPPWGAEFTDSERSYLTSKYPLVPTKAKDSYLYFLFLALGALRSNGLLGFITPNTWLLINNAVSVRRELLSLSVKQIIDYGDGVFKQATVESAVLILEKTQCPAGDCRAVRIRKGKVVVDHLVEKQLWLDDEYCRVIVDIDYRAQQLVRKLRGVAEPFGACCTITWGIKPYQVGYGVPPQTREMLEKRVYHSATKDGGDWKPLLVGTDVNRYEIRCFCQAKLDPFDG